MRSLHRIACWLFDHRRVRVVFKGQTWVACSRCNVTLVPPTPVRPVHLV